MKNFLAVVLVIFSVGTVGYIFFKNSESLRNRSEAEKKNIYGEEKRLFGIIPSNGKFITVIKTTYDPKKDSTIEKKKDEAEVDFSVIEECKKAIEESDVNLAYFYPWHDGDKLILNGVDTGISAGNYYSGQEIVNLKLDGENTLFRKKVGSDYYDVYNGKETLVDITDFDIAESKKNSAKNNNNDSGIDGAGNCKEKNYKEVVCSGKTVWKGNIAGAFHGVAFTTSGDNFALVSTNGKIIFNGREVGDYSGKIEEGQIDYRGDIIENRIDGRKILSIDDSRAPVIKIIGNHIIFLIEEINSNTEEANYYYSFDGRIPFLTNHIYDVSVVKNSFVSITSHTDEGRVIFNGIDCGRGRMPVLSPK